MRSSARIGGLACLLAGLIACGRGAPRPADAGTPDGADPDSGGEAPEADGEDFDSHLARLSASVPPGFTVVPCPPFVVVGDEPPAAVRERTEIVAWTVRMLRQDYGVRDPERPIDIWLFRDDASYRRWTRERFGDRPTTGFGYYSPEHGALLMNIATGGGTLVHEIVHPLLHATLPGLPPWINEGLASLYEQCGEEDGHLRGYVNWRLSGLQRSLVNGSTLPLARLLALTSEQFYGGSGGGYAASSRYVMYFLQEHGLLPRFYEKFRELQAIDPSGKSALLGVVEESDLSAFEERWRRWVLAIEYPSLEYP